MYAVRSHDGDVQYGVNEYVCDTDAELKNLPNCKMGSVAFVIKDSETGESALYMKAGNGQWEKV